MSDRFKFYLQRFATIRGTEGHDYLTTETVDSVVIGYGENDTVWNAYDNVIIEGGDGTDSIKSGNGYWDNGPVPAVRRDNSTTNNTYISSGAGDDFITINGGDSTITADEGNDIILSWHNSNYLNGGAGNDSINNGSSNSTLVGESGNDSLNNSGANATLLGNAGEDKVTNSGSYAFIDGGDDKDIIWTKSSDNFCQ